MKFVVSDTILKNWFRSKNLTPLGQVSCKSASPSAGDGPGRHSPCVCVCPPANLNFIKTCSLLFEFFLQQTDIHKHINGYENIEEG